MNDDQQTAEPKVPSRTIGFSVMSVVIVVVATFLYQQQVLRKPQTEQFHKIFEYKKTLISVGIILSIALVLLVAFL